MAADLTGAGEVTEDSLLGGRVRLRQPQGGHRAGTDAVLLAGLADIRPGDRVVDLGSGSGAVGLMIAARVTLGRLTLVERDPALVRLAAENLELNGAGPESHAVQADAFGSVASWHDIGLPVGEADVVVTNPPFLDGRGRPSPDPARRQAHVMPDGGLAGWIGAAGRLAASRGRLWLIHRADALGDCLTALRTGFGSVVIRPIYPRPDRAATRVVISAVKGGRAPLRLEPGLALHGPDGRFTPVAATLHSPPDRDAQP